MKIGIVGCGPAGLSAAIALHDAGHHVCLFEQFDSPRPVGSGLMLQPTGLDVLQGFGLREQCEALGQRIDGMLGRVSPNGKVVLDIQYDALNGRRYNDLYGVAIHRASLFHVLFEAVKMRGIQIVTNTRINTIDTSFTNNAATKVQLVDQFGLCLPDAFDFVVDASGTQSQLANQLGNRAKPKAMSYGALWTTVKLDKKIFNETLLEQRYEAASIMVGVLPCGRLPNEEQSLATLFWSIRADQFDAFVSNGLSAWKQSVIKQWPDVSILLNDIEHIDQLTHATYTHHTMRKPYGTGIVFIGDAAHATSPQLGQGANMALLDALALSQAINSSENFDDFAPLYARMRRNHVKLFQAASLLLTPFYQSDNRLLPAIRDTFFEPVTKIPFVSKLVASLGSGLLTDPVSTINRCAMRTNSK